MNQPNGAGGKAATTPTPTPSITANTTQDTVRVKIKKKALKRMWKDGGPSQHLINFKTLYYKETNTVMIEFGDTLGPVFRFSALLDDMRAFCDNLYDNLLQIELDLEQRQGAPT